MKQLSVVIVSMICMILSVSVFAEEVEQETFTSGDYGYILLEDGTVEIKNYYGEDEELEVPGELDGFIVTSIGDGAFGFCTSLSNITIP